MFELLLHMNMRYFLSILDHTYVTYENVIWPTYVTHKNMIYKCVSTFFTYVNV